MHAQYGEIYPDNLWVFTPLGSSTLTLQPPTPSHPKNLVVIHYKTGKFIEQHDYVLNS